MKEAITPHGIRNLAIPVAQLSAEKFAAMCAAHPEHAALFVQWRDAGIVALSLLAPKEPEKE
jgi:hypothetical protein